MERVSQVTLQQQQPPRHDGRHTHPAKHGTYWRRTYSTVSVPLSVGWCEEWQRRVAYHGARNTRGLRLYIRFVVNRNSPGRSFWSVGRSRWLLCVQSLFQPHTTTPRTQSRSRVESTIYIPTHHRTVLHTNQAGSPAAAAVGGCASNDRSCTL